MTHTPLPWRIEDERAPGAPEIVGNGHRIARVLYDPGSEDNQVHDNARLIVRACNSHAELLEALREVTQCLRAITMPGEYEAELRQADAAIAKAGG